MTHWSRFAYAGVLTAVAGAIIIILLGVTSPEMAKAFVFDHYWVGLYVIAYLVAPILRRYIKAH
jgi:hypothetical protein